MLERQRTGLPGSQPSQNAENTRVTIPIGDGPALGRADAPLLLVEFTDLQCPYCKRFNDSVLPELVKNYVEAGKLRITSRSLALPFHAQAEPAAHAVLCAHHQDKFWAMRELLFSSNTSLGVSNFTHAAELLKLDVPAFRACIDGKAFAQQLRKDSADAQAAGITGTPSFVLGKPAGGKVSGLLIVGARPFAFFDAEVKKLLSAPN